MPHQKLDRAAAITVIAAGVLVGGLALLLDAGRVGWPEPELRPEPPWGPFLVVVGVGMLVLGGVALRSRRVPRLWEYGIVLVAAIAATRLSTYGGGGAQPCCETGWIFGYGYPFQYRFTGWVGYQVLGRKAAEAAAEPTLGEPVAHAADLVFWFYAAILVYLPARLLALRATSGRLKG